MDYLISFMNSCISSGKSSVHEITNLANNRIQEIENKIKQIEELKKEEKALKSLVKQLGGDTQKQDALSIESNIIFSSLDNQIKDISLLIIHFMNDKLEISVRDIIDSVSSLEHSKFIMTSLKWLIDNKVLSRDDSSRKIGKGELWAEKENVLNIINLKN